MGYIAHHAIVVTGGRFEDEPSIDDAHRVATEAGCHPSEILGPMTNGTFSFFVPSDGSKEGWDASEEGDRARDALVGWLRQRDGGWFDWVEVRYSPDDAAADVTRHAWLRGA